MVRSRDARWFTKGALAIALTGLAACSEQPTGTESVQSPTMFSASGNHGSRNPRLVTSGARYSDTGVKPATGRSGSAAITAEAVFSSSGQTDLVVTPFRASDLSFLTPAGCLEKVQVKLFGSNGRLLWTRNYNNVNYASGVPFRISYTGAPPGTRFQVQANVKCIDNRRTDVVTASPAVIRRTDPSVTSLLAPDSTLRNYAVVARATVREMHGDQGATGVCRLYVDDVLLQSISNVWVDAGSTVECAFALTFGTIGTRTLRVTFESATPRDDDLTNNDKSAAVRVVTATPPPPPPPPGDTTPPPPPPPPPVVPPQAFSISAQAYDDTLSTWEYFAHSYRDPTVSTVYPIDSLLTVDTVIGNEQQAQFDGIIYEAIPVNIARLSVSQSTASPTSGPFLYHSFVGTNLVLSDASASGSLCLSAPAASVLLTVCSYAPDASFPLGATRIAYGSTGAAAMYISVGYAAYFDGEAYQACYDSGDPTVRTCYYDTRPAGAPLQPYGSTYTFSVLLETANRRFSTVVVLPVIRSDSTWSNPIRLTQTTWGTLVYTERRGDGGFIIRRAGDAPSIIGVSEALP